MFVLWNICVTFTLLLERLKVFTKRASIPASGCRNLILLFLGSVFLAEIVTERMESYEWTMISLELICMINLGTYHIYHKVVENYEERIEKAEILQEKQDVFEAVRNTTAVTTEY